MKVKEKHLSNKKIMVKKQKGKLIPQTINFINHNFTIFYDNTNKFFFAIGGLNRNQKPYKDYDEISGIYLLKSEDLLN
jgi:hypothetical protein